MSNVILYESLVIVALIFVCYILVKMLNEKKAEIKNLEKDKANLRKEIENYAEIRKKTIENQKKYRSNDDISNFNASLDFLRNNETRKESVSGVSSVSINK